MEKYRILEHKSDLKIRVFGETKEELFENAMKGMFEAAGYKKEAKSQKSKVKIKVKSQNLSFLLVDFLSEVLYLVETRREVYDKIKFERFSDRKIEAELEGKRLKRMGVEIKGVTYHNLDISQKGSTWQATILFDI